MLGTIVGPRRIALDVESAQGRLVLDGDVGPPLYPFGITLPGRLSTPEVDADVSVHIDPAQLVGLWLGINHLLP